MASLKDFEIVTKLGEGSFGQVYKVRRKADKVTYVMKQINISKMNGRQRNEVVTFPHVEALNEVTILSKLDNQYIVKYFDSFIDKQVLCIIMEYCDMGDLHCFLKGQLGRPLTENQVWRFLIQMCMGLSYLHRSKILHRDIKSMNIFLCRDQAIRIGDLGVAKVLSDQNNFARTMVGTPYYLSPEMCEEKPYNEKSDIWALGCVLYELCTFKHPFEASNQGALVLKIIRGRYEPISSRLYTPGLIALVDSCLQKDLKTRPTAYDLIQQKILIQSAKQLDLNINLQAPHPTSVQYKQPQQQQQRLEQQTPAKPESAKVALVVKGTSQALQVAPKPNLDRVVSAQPHKERYPQETPQPARKEPPKQQETPQVIRKDVQQSPAPKVIIKSSAFNAKQLQQQQPPQPPQQKQPQVAQPQPQAPLSSKEYENLYQDWKLKAEELQGDQVKTVVPVPTKQALPPSKKPISQPSPVRAAIKPAGKARVRKGAPQELARKAQQVPNKKELEDARDKLRLLKSKQAKVKSEVDQDMMEVMNLPDRIPATKREVQVQQPVQQVVEDIDEFFNDQIQMIREHEQQLIQTIKPTYPRSQKDPDECSPDDQEIDNTEEANTECQEFYNDIPLVEADEEFEEPEEELIVFEEEQVDHQNDSDQEAYFEEQQEAPQQFEEDATEYFIGTIKEDPREFEDTRHYQDEEEELVIDTNKLQLNKHILENEKRKVELQMLMQAKVRECVRELGQNKTTELIDFLRKKLNSDVELNDDDQEEINDMVQSKYIGQHNPQILYTFYKILHYEIELDKCNENIAKIHEKLEEY